jgi:hypothetical protein
MAFLYPYFLFGLLALLIPIAVHFFNFHRYKKVYFTNVSLLSEIEIKSKKNKELYKRLLLLARCLTIIFLCLVFAQPYFKDKEGVLVKEGENIVVVFVDNSFSVKLDMAKLKAKEVADMYSTTDKFCLLTMELSGKERHFVDKKMFLHLLSEIETSPCSKMMSEVYNTAHKLANTTNGNNKVCFFISDFQKTCLDEENFKQDSINNVFIPLETSQTNNVFIDSLWCESKNIMKGASLDLKVRVKNSSNNDIEKLPLKLIVENKQVAIASIDMLAGEQKVVDLSFSVENNGILHSKVSISDSPIIFDNDFYFTLIVKDKARVLSLNQTVENPYLMRLFAEDEQVLLENANLSNPNYNSFSSYSMIILNGLQQINEGLSNELKKYVDNSGSLLIVPDKNMDLDNVNAFLSKMSLPQYSALQNKTVRVSEFDEENSLFEGVFSTYIENISLPSSKMYFPLITNSTTAKQSILTYSNGDDFFIVSAKNSSNVYMLSVGLDTIYGDFVNNSLFVPLMWNMCALSQVNTNLYYTLGEMDLIDLGRFVKDTIGEELLSVKAKEDSMSFVPQFIRNQSGYVLKLYNQIEKSGHYDVMYAGNVISGFSMNYSSRESLMEFADKELKDFKASGLQAYKSNKTFILFIILALLSILFEAFLLKKINKIN